MPITVRPLRADEGRMYLDIVNSAIRGLAGGHDPSDAIDRWVVLVTDETVRDLMLNTDHEIRLVAELDGEVVGSGALMLERAELRACYVSLPFARRGCGSALVHEIERLARENGLTHLELAASLVLRSPWVRSPGAKRRRSQQRSQDGGSLDDQASLARGSGCGLR